MSFSPTIGQTTRMSKGHTRLIFHQGVLSVPELWGTYREMEKLPNLAGADYHVGFGNGYIEGAIRSGQRVAMIVHERISEFKRETKNAKTERK